MCFVSRVFAVLKLSQLAGSIPEDSCKFRNLLAVEICALLMAANMII